MNKRQKQFVKEYLIDLNATQAAIRSGYKTKTAGVIGHELLKKPYIQSLIQESILERQQKLDIKQEDVLKSLKNIMDANMADYASWDSDSLVFFDSNTLSRDMSYCIKKISIDAKGKFKIELHDKVRAAVALLEHTTPQQESLNKLDVNIKVIDTNASRMNIESIEY